MIKIGTTNNKVKSIAIVVLVLAIIFGIGYFIGYYGTDLIKKM